MKRRLFSMAIHGPLLLLQSLAALAQGSGAATHVSESDIMAALQGITNLPDQQVRTVDVGGGLNIAIGVLKASRGHKHKMKEKVSHLSRITILSKFIMSCLDLGIQCTR